MCLLLIAEQKKEKKKLPVPTPRKKLSDQRKGIDAKLMFHINDDDYYKDNYGHH